MSKRLKISADAEGADRDGDGIVWFLYTGQARSEIPRDVTHVRIDPTVKKIGNCAFMGCEKLVEVKLCEGLEEIGQAAFRGCNSLHRIKIPSTVKKIDQLALYGCIQLKRVELCEGLEKIGRSAFTNCSSLPTIKIPSTVKVIDGDAFSDCDQLMGVELCNGVKKILAFDECFSLRNLVISPEVEERRRPHPGTGALQCFAGCHDLMKLFGSPQHINDSLNSRFVGLPIHKICYYQSYHPTEMTIDQLKRLMVVSNYQDCVGMTPLHILACSTTHNIDLYRFIDANYPKSLITEDKWGCLPIPQEIVQFLITSQMTAFPSIILNWDGMLETLCRAGTPLETVQRLLVIHQTSFSHQRINWQKAAREMAICYLIKSGCDSHTTGNVVSNWVEMMEFFNSSQVHHNHELIHSLQELQQRFSPDQTTGASAQIMCEEFVKPLKGWWMPVCPSKSWLVF